MGDDSIKVEYLIDNPYYINETHLYVGADAPATQAPGQLGHLHENLGEADYDSYMIGLEGLTMFYIAAHGVVAGDCSDGGDGSDGGGDDPTYFVNGTVYFDVDENYLYDGSDTGLSGVTVELYDAVGNLVASTTTDGFGAYSFDDLADGAYTIVVDPEGILGGLVKLEDDAAGSIVVNGVDVLGVNVGFDLPNISGTVFFDITDDGQQDIDEPGISDITISLVDSYGNVIATTTTDENGFYEVEVMPGDYTVVVEGPDGLIATNPVSVAVAVGYADESVDFGFELDFDFIVGQTANGYTIGFWKNNLIKAISGKQKGIQIDAATLQAYVDELSDFALYPLNVNSMDEAATILSARGSDAVLLLSKQLMGSEFNLMNGAYIGGYEIYTEMFLYYGEYLIAHATDYSDWELLEAKDLYDAYNNSHGGQIAL